MSEQSTRLRFDAAEGKYRIYAPWGGYVTTFESRHEALAHVIPMVGADMRPRAGMVQF